VVKIARGASVGVRVGVFVLVGVRVGLGVTVSVGDAVKAGVRVYVLVLLGMAVQLAVGTIVTGELHAARKQTETNTQHILAMIGLVGNVVLRCYGEK
jgi:hypothetical protein